MNNLQKKFGNIDIYLFDQLLKGTYDKCKKVIDVGCGNGRNIIYFLRNGFEVFGIDPQPEAIEYVKSLATQLAPGSNTKNFTVGFAEDLSYEDNFFDLVICSAVLHFARDHQHFNGMVTSMWRTLKPGGFFFARLASKIGIEDNIVEQGNGRFKLPDGSERFLVDHNLLIRLTENVNGSFYEPIKTTNVQKMRCMTTWCIQKKS
jgi:tellurite methyltransferase